MMNEYMLTLYLSVAGLMDLRCRRVNNSWILCGLLTGFMVNPAGAPFGLGLGAISILLYLAGVLGAGDVKLLMVAGCYLGADGFGDFLIPTVFSAGGLIIVYGVSDLMRPGDRILKNGAMPLAPAMFMGALFAAMT